MEQLSKLEYATCLIQQRQSTVPFLSLFHIVFFLPQDLQHPIIDCSGVSFVLGSGLFVSKARKTRAQLTIRIALTRRDKTEHVSHVSASKTESINSF